MTRLVPVMLLMIAACGGKEPAPSELAPTEAPAPKPEPARAPPKDQPKRVLVERIVLSFAGNEEAGLKSTRPKAEAERLARSLVLRIRGGADIRLLRDEYSDDREEGSAVANGPYILCNYGVPHHLRKDNVAELPRENLFRSFGDLAFALEPGDVGLAEYDEKNCPHGWDIVYRVR